MNIVAKLSGEIQNFTLIQFLAVLIGLAMALHFFVQAKPGSEDNYLAAALMVILTLGMVGFCNFNIHRNGAYLEYAADVPDDVRRYEEAKGKHTTTKVVVPAAMAVLLIPLLYIGIASYVAGREFYPSWLYRAGIPILGAVAVILYGLGVQLGRWGWQHLASH